MHSATPDCDDAPLSPRQAALFVNFCTRSKGNPKRESPQALQKAISPSMVYCGKPSKGCGQCRTRKIRCDQAQPACSQCVRAKRECPGYRDQLSLMFRDESKSVVRKAKAEAGSSASSASSARSRQKRTPTRSSRIASPDGSGTGSQTPSELTLPLVDPAYNFIFDMDPPIDFNMPNPWSLPLEVQPPPEASKQEAICYFLRGNAIPGSLWMGDFVTRFLAEPGATLSQKAMQSSIVAVSSAMLCRVRKMWSLRDMAQKEYVSALNLLNTALADAEEAKTNQALGAVILLAVYEVSLFSSMP